MTDTLVSMMQAIENRWNIPGCELFFSEGERGGSYAVYHVLPFSLVPESFGEDTFKGPVQFDLFSPSGGEMAAAAELLKKVKSLYHDCNLEFPGFETCTLNQFWPEMDGTMVRISIRFNVQYSEGA